MILHPWTSVILLGALLTGGCGDRSDAPASAGDTPQDRLAIETVVGGLDDSRPEYEFGRVTGLALLGDGRVAAADGQNHVVRVYAPDGTHRFSFGRDGSGPGEVRRPCCLAVDTAQRLWVRDGGNARYNVYRIDTDSASYLYQVRMAHGDVNRHAPVTFDGVGGVIDIGTRHDPATGARYVARMRVDSAGNEIASVAMHTVPADSTAMKSVQRATATGSETRFAHQPFGPAELTAHSPAGEYAHALSSRYAVDWRDRDGHLIRHISGDVASGPELSAAERQRGEDQIASQLDFVGVSRGQLGFDLPARKQPLRNLFFDRDGRLWIELSVADGADRVAHVYAAGGTLERFVVWPADVDLTLGAIRGDTAWGVRRDELGVPALVRLAAAPAAQTGVPQR